MARVELKLLRPHKTDPVYKNDFVYSVCEPNAKMRQQFKAYIACQNIAIEILSRAQYPS